MIPEPTPPERRERVTRVRFDPVTGLDLPDTSVTPSSSNLAVLPGALGVPNAPGFPGTPSAPGALNVLEIPEQVKANSNGSQAEQAADERVGAQVDERVIAAFPLHDNVYVLAPNRERLDPAAEAELLLPENRDRLDPFDLPERERMYILATQFVDNHVRRLRSGASIKARNRIFADDTIVVSEKRFPRLPFRLVKLNWAIERNNVVDVHDHRVMCGRLTRFKVPLRRFIWGPGRGDSYDLAYLLGNVCAITGMHVPQPVAVTGDVDLLTNQILGSGLIEDKREAALNDRMAHLILPFRTHLMPGDHGGVRYWPARDVNEAAFSLFSASCSELAIPDLKRRWRLKMAYSWVSLLAVLTGIGAYQFAAGFGSDPLAGNPTLLRWTLGIAVGLFAVSSFATHRYWRMDR